MEMGAIRVGCSGWNYRHWRGPFYPEKLAVKRWFDTVGARPAVVKGMAVPS